MPYCSILNCKHNSKDFNVSHGGVSYHRFPRNPHIKERWIEATGRTNWMPTKGSTVCSQHFEPRYYIIKKSGNRYLSDEAVPTLKVVRFYSGNQVKVKNEPPTDPDLDVEQTPFEPNIDIDIVTTENARIPNADKATDETEPNASKDLETYTFVNIDEHSSIREQKWRRMIRGRDEMIKRQARKIKSLQSQYRRLSKRYEILERELKRRKIEEGQAGIVRKKYIHQKKEDTTKHRVKHLEVEIIRL